MASGATLLALGPQANQAPSASFATLDLRNGHPVLDFDAAADEAAIFTAVLPRLYGGGGITVTLIWAATSATSGTCRWGTAIERMEDEGTDTDSGSFATAVTVGATAPATSGALQYTAIAHTSGAQMDSVVAGEAFRLKVYRDADGTSGTDDMTGDAELFAVEIKET